MKTKNYNRDTSCHFCNLSVFKSCKIFNCFDTFYNFVKFPVESAFINPETCGLTQR